MSRRTTVLLGVVILLVIALAVMKMNTANVQQQAQIQLDNRQMTLEATPAP